MSTKVAIAWAALALAAACATVPERFSAHSPASLESPAAPTTVVARALREDPPLPGAPAEGWTGLGGPPSGGGMGGMHHHHHPGMDMSGMDRSGMDVGDAGAPAPADAGASSMEGMHHAH